MNNSYFSQLEKIKILSRLKRVEGQIRGIQGMITEVMELILKFIR